MNNTRRKELRKAIELLERASALIEDARCIIEDVQSEEEDAYYNMPESIQESEKGCSNEEAREHMEDALNIDNEDNILEMIDYLEQAIECRG